MNDARPKFSIVIPTIGRLDLIKRALYTALRQQDHFDDYEVVVLDNCSEDGTWDYLQSIKNPRLKTFRNSHRLPQAQNWNKAVRLSSGEYIYMLADDNVLLPEMLATISSSLARRKNVDLVCFEERHMVEDERDQHTFWSPEREELLSAPWGLVSFGREWRTNASFMVFSRAVYDRYGEFDESSLSHIILDIEYILRWLIHCDVLLIPGALAMHRAWPGSLTVTTLYTPEMLATLTYNINRILGFATDSGRLDPDQLEDLRQTLVQILLVDVFEAASREDVQLALRSLQGQDDAAGDRPEGATAAYERTLEFIEEIHDLLSDAEDATAAYERTPESNPGPKEAKEKLDLLTRYLRSRHRRETSP